MANMKIVDALDAAIAAASIPPTPLFKERVSATLMTDVIEVIEIAGSSSFRMVDNDVAILMDALMRAQGTDVFLTVLSLRNHHITDIGFSSICASTVGGLGQPSKITGVLRILDLEGNDIEGKNMSELRLEHSHDCMLESLNLSHNPLALGTGMILANAVRTNRSLQSLSLNACGFPLNTVIALATTLRQNTSLRILQLNRPLISTRQEEGTDHLSRLLGGSGSRLEHLSLRYHGIADFGARLLATSLASHAALTYLDLERNKINTSGCEALASHMILQPEGGAVLRTLLLSYNQVGDEGAIALAEVLRSNRALTQLSLKNNGVHESGLMEIGNALLTNTNLTSLSLFGNEFSHRTGQVFLNSLKQQQQPLAMDFQVYEVDNECMVAELPEEMA